MKTGMNLLLWTTEVTPEHDKLLDRLKQIGFDAVEVPVFNIEDRAPMSGSGSGSGATGSGRPP